MDITDTGVAEHNWISVQRFDDIDAQAAHYLGYGQQYQQLGRGPFEGRFKSFNFGDDLIIHQERANRELAQSASTPAGRYGACLLEAGTPSCSVNATTFAQDHALLCPEHKILEGKTPRGMSMYCIDVSYDLLSAEVFDMPVWGVIDDPTRSAQLRQLVESGIATFTALETLSGYPAACLGFRSSVADMLWQITNQISHAQAKRLRRYGPRILRVFRRAREYIDHELSDGISITALCYNTGVSRRSLECAFRAVVGTGPGNYIRALQLNRVRRHLISGASGEVSIGIIAASHGIWHWSRFSQNYRAMFGELPSETRSRGVRRSMNESFEPNRHPVSVS